MNSYQISKLYQLKKKYQPVKEKIDYLMDKGSTQVHYASQRDYEPGKLSEYVATAGVLKGYMSIGHSVIKEVLMLKKIKKELVIMGLYKEDEIVLDINELLAMKGKAKVLMGSIDYRANIPREYLTSLELIWSDASFIALNELRKEDQGINISKYIKNLKVVMGDLIFNDLTCPIGLMATGGVTNLTYIKDVSKLHQYTTSFGDIKVTGANYPKSMDYVGGDILVEGDEVIQPSDFMSINHLEGDIIFVNKNKRVKRHNKINVLV